MSDDALIRLANLKRLKLSAQDLSDKVGGRYTYWRDLLAGEKSFGEKAARKIEEALAIPRKWLDGDGLDHQGLPAAKSKPAPSPASRDAPSPMARELAFLFDQIPDDEAHYLVRKEIDQACTEVILKALRRLSESANPAPARPALEQTPHE